MIEITFPDGAKKEFESGVNSLQIAKSISPSLAKITVGAYVNGQLADAKDKIEENVELKLITTKDEDGLEILRHSCAHLLAHAVKELYPQAKIAIGPTIENGFYYDISLDKSLTDADLPKIEKKMKEISKKSYPINYKEVSVKEAIEIFEAQNETYKVEIIKNIPANDTIKIYQQGDFMDLCRGPHVPSTSNIKVFKLMRLAGAYWKGDSNNEMLQRIYGTCWANKDDLTSYLLFLEEAEKRDHRKIGKKLDLFHFQDDSPGIPFWHDNGVKIWREVEDYMRASNNKYGCKEIRTPLIADFTLWEKSGHASKYAENMFATKSENRDFAIRPMNCPTCVQVYNTKLHSYRDLPIRMAEFGVVHRNEPSGSLHGLLRVRSFTQDDGHVFCTEEQVKEEVILMVEQCFEVYKDFGFDFEVKIALRPENRIGSEETWDKSEQTLISSLEEKGIKFELLPGEGAFYGPKIEFHLKDAIGRSWQCGTIQLDFSMPERLGANYIDENSNKKTPVMLHRAIVGSLERFIGMLIEHYAGNLPLWLAPVQIAIMGVNNNQDEYCRKVASFLQKYGIRVNLDLRNEKIGFKIRENTLSRIPYLIVLGKNEQENDVITVRKHSGEDLGQFTLQEFKDKILTQIADKN